MIARTHPIQGFGYLHADVPPGMTLAEYRRRLATRARPGPLGRLRRRLRSI